MFFVCLLNTRVGLFISRLMLVDLQSLFLPEHSYVRKLLNFTDDRQRVSPEKLKCERTFWSDTG